MRFLTRTAGYTGWDHKRNEDILTENRITNLTDNRIHMSVQRKNWKEHVDWMSSDRIQKIILRYQPKGKINLGRPLKRWKDSVL
jgi:hypothetical protein